MTPLWGSGTGRMASPAWLRPAGSWESTQMMTGLHGVARSPDGRLPRQVAQVSRDHRGSPSSCACRWRSTLARASDQTAAECGLIDLHQDVHRILAHSSRDTGQPGISGQDPGGQRRWGHRYFRQLIGERQPLSTVHWPRTPTGTRFGSCQENTCGPATQRSRLQAPRAPPASAATAVGETEPKGRGGAQPHSPRSQAVADRPRS